MGSNEHVATTIAKMAIAARRLGECVFVESGEDLRLRLPAISDLAPIDEDTYDLVQSQQMILVTALLIDAFKREGWHANLSDDIRGDSCSVRIEDIVVDVDYDNMNAGYTPDEPYLMMVSVSLGFCFAERWAYSDL